MKVPPSPSVCHPVHQWPSTLSKCHPVFPIPARGVTKILSNHRTVHLYHSVCVCPTLWKSFQCDQLFVSLTVSKVGVVFHFVPCWHGVSLCPTLALCLILSHAGIVSLCPMLALCLTLSHAGIVSLSYTGIVSLSHAGIVSHFVLHWHCIYCCPRIDLCAFLQKLCVHVYI